VRRANQTLQVIIKSFSKQDRQRTYNVTFRRVHAATVAMEKQNVLHILSVYLYT